MTEAVPPQQPGGAEASDRRELAPGFALGTGDLSRSEDPVLAAVLAIIPDPVFRVHRDGRVLGMWAGPGNRIPAEGVEYFRFLSERSELDLADILAPELTERVLKVITEVLDTGTPRVIEYRHEVLGVPRSLQGRCARCGPDEVIWLTDDITDAVEAREQLEEHEARYHAVVETLDEAIVLHDRHGLPYALNRAAIQLFGALDGSSTATDAFSGPDVLRIDEDGNERDPAQNPVMVTLRTGEPQHGRVIGFARPGHPTRWLSVTTQLLEAGVDRPVSVVSTSVDITDEKARRAAAASRAEFERLLSSCSAAVLAADGDDLDAVARSCLCDLAEHFDADVAFFGDFRSAEVFELLADWRRSGIPPRPPVSRRSRMSEHRHSFKRLSRNGVVLIRTPDDLEPGMSYSNASMEIADRSFAWVVVGPPDRPAGFLGLIWKRSDYDGPRGPLERLARVGEAMLSAFARRRVERLSTGQRDVLELIARGAPLGESLEAVARLRESGGPSVRTAVFLVDGSGSSLVLGAAPSLDEAARSTLHRHALDRDSLSVEVMRTGRAAWIDSTECTERFGAFRADLRAHGICTMSAAPVVSSQSGKAVGVIASYDLDPDPLALVDPLLDQACTTLAAIAIERASDVAELSHQATHDGLTGVANRVAMLDRLEQALMRARAHGTLVAVLFCDLDRFKEVNDRFGHELGDQLLREVANRIAAVVERTDTVSRFGGDEFVLLCDELRDEDHALQIADRVAHAVGDTPFDIGGTLVPLTTSIGVAFSTATADHPEALVRDADVAMYRAKASGRARREVFHESIRRAARDRDELAQELALAIHDEELELHFQPIVSVEHGRVEGLEALVRWPHPTRGRLSPGSFIPVAEETGLIVPLGRWVTEEALRRLAEWSEADPRWSELLMHVNVSARQLTEPGYVDDLVDTIARSSVDPGRVMLEITESILMHDSPSSRAAISGLHASGAGLVLDDFGTGYASLTYLRRFPLRGIKVDRSFVAGLGVRTDDAAIVGAVVELGGSLGLDVVAEGVETEAQARLLGELGCLSAQGYFYARPSPPEAIPALLESISGVGRDRPGGG